MADPYFEVLEDPSSLTEGTPVSSGNPVDFGLIEKGSISDTIRINIWNDRDGSMGSDTAVAPRLHAVQGDDNPLTIFNGTTANGNVSMLEARSCGAYGVVADQHQEWYPIGPTEFLDMGDIPAGAMRQIELRLNIPIDAANLAINDFTLRVQF